MKKEKPKFGAFKQFILVITILFILILAFIMKKYC